VRNFVDAAAATIGLTLQWEGSGVDEIGYVKSARECNGVTPKVKPGQTIVRVDPRYFRPTEVETLLGDASKAHAKLGWKSSTTFEQLVSEMMASDLEEVGKYVLVNQNGYNVHVRSE
jgi:GDPmannose 4,6-dehydratase